MSIQSIPAKTLRRALGATMLSTTALVSGHQALAADPQVLESIIVEGQSLPAIVTTDVNRSDLPPAADGGAFLKSIPGVDAVRMGGHGLDPVIRGQQQEQLNVIGDGAFMYGGCPNRMDPPAALTSIDTYDSVTVEKGFQSVRHGPGGSGGAIILERKAPSLTDDKPYQVKFSAGGNSNGAAYNGTLDASAKVSEGYVRAQGTKSRGKDYDDGNGKEVRSGFKQWSAGMELGWTPGNGTELSFGVERDRTDDVLFAGTGMDAPYGITDVARLKFAKDLEGSTMTAVRFNAYDSRVDHLMDNYSLRPFTAGMYMRTPTSSDTQGFKIEADLDAGSVPLTVGVDYKTLDRDAIRYRGASATTVNLVQSYIWPGVESREIGVFGEGKVALDEARAVKLGLRYDNVHVTADKADIVADVAGGAANDRSANQLYNLYYGYGFTTVDENNISGLLRYEQKMSEDTTTFVTVSRSVRTANTTERTMAADMAAAAQRRVGNPRIDPEQHYQLDVGMDTTLAGWGVSASAYYDRVQDYIFRDVARGQSDILLSDTAVVYRNIDATLTGLDLTAQHTFTNMVSLNGSLSFTYGQNEETDRALPQIPPMKLGVDVSYPMGEWLLGTRVNGALKQTRVDLDTATGSGRDVQKTSGYVTADLYGSRFVGDNIELGLGVTNLFDKVYANHLNKSNAFDNTEVQVNEPGRSFYLRVTGTF